MPPQNLCTHSVKNTDSLHGMRIQISAMAEEEFNSVFLQPTPAHWPSPGALQEMRWHHAAGQLHSHSNQGTVSFWKSKKAAFQSVYPSTALPRA